MSEEGPAPRTRWVPTAVGALLAVAMLWLASNPFDPPAPGPAEAMDLPKVALVTPRGEQKVFPSVFEWREVRGADLYEITVVRADEEQVPLFRQRGTTTLLELSWDNSSRPPAGEYLWEVLATRREFPVAIGSGAFLVLE